LEFALIWKSNNPLIHHSSNPIYFFFNGLATTGNFGVNSRGAFLTSNWFFISACALPAAVVTAITLITGPEYESSKNRRVAQRDQFFGHCHRGLFHGFHHTMCAKSFYTTRECVVQARREKQHSPFYYTYCLYYCVFKSEQKTA